MRQKQMVAPTHVVGTPVQVACPKCGREDVRLLGLRAEDGGVGQR